VPHVLAVTTLEIRNPVTFNIGVKTDDPAGYTGGSRSVAVRARHAELC
jgi:hypothetical protein